MEDQIDNSFSVSPESLSQLFEPDNIRNGKSIEILNSSLNGISGIFTSVRSSLTKGITEESSKIEERAKHFGDNRPHIYNKKSFFHFLFEPLKDTVLQILIVAALISLIVGVIEDPEQGWIEGIAILVTVCIVLVVTATNDYQKEAQFIKLNLETDTCKLVVLRDGVEKEVSVKELLTGDILSVATGDILQGDGIYLKGSGLDLDESSITGESKLMKKEALIQSETILNPFVVSGAKIIEGSGLVLILAVGPHSQLGKSRRMINSLADEPETPLQERLTVLATIVGKFGFYAGLALTSSLLIPLFIEAALDSQWGHDQWEEVIKSFILGITILVVAIPEGLPLALTMAMAYSILRMKDEQIFVRHLKGCEIMGAATNILSDKTGTLTQNKMTVTRAFLLGESFENTECLTLSNEDKKFVAENIGRNTTAHINTKDGKSDLIGNRSECAMLLMCKGWGYDYHDFRNPELSRAQYAFNPRTKRMTTVYDSGKGEIIIYTKGAGEVILEICSDELLCDGKSLRLSDDRKKQIKDIIVKYSSLSLRVITYAYKKTTWEELGLEDSDGKLNQEMIEKDLIFLGLVGIEDPLRQESKSSVRKCQQAGVIVRMVTGDSLETAEKIARSCAILPNGVLDSEIDEYVMEGSVFRERVGGLVTVTNGEGKLESLKVGNMDEFKTIAPKLRVIARCSPEDKLLFVIGLKALGEVVAVTGDGSNDAPALKQSDIGLAMMSGTSLAKESSDIILLDDNFESVVNSVKWGRNVYASIRKFLTFQMTCNTVAVTISVVGAVSVSESPLSAVQMLWVNLIMDALAALALATEKPTDDLFYTKPFGRTEKIITRDMTISIVTQAIYQIVILLVILFDGASLFDVKEGWGNDSWSTENGRHFTIIFQTFVMMQVFNEINCRKLSLLDINVFKGFFNNNIFLGILAITAIVQILIVQYGGYPIKCSGLSLTHHLICAGLGLGCIFVSLVVRTASLCLLGKKRLIDDENSPLLKNN